MNDRICTGCSSKLEIEKNKVENISTDTIANITLPNKVAKSIFLNDFVVLSLLIPMGFQRETGK